MKGKGITDFFRQLIFGRDSPTKKTSRLLKKCGDKKITGLTIIREPVSSGIQKMLDVLTLGKIKKDMVKQGYDRLFHLSALIELDGCPTLRLEKNETVNLERPKKFHPEIEKRTIPVEGDITLQEAYDKLRISFKNDKTLYSYDSIKNNCQKFIRKFLVSNKSNFKYKDSDLSFITQDIEFIAKNYPFTSKIAKVLTDIANKLGVLTGRGKSKKILVDDIKESKILKRKEDIETMKKLSRGDIKVLAQTICKKSDTKKIMNKIKGGAIKMQLGGSDDAEKIDDALGENKKVIMTATVKDIEKQPKSRLKRWASKAKKGLLSIAKGTGSVLKDVVRMGFETAKQQAGVVGGMILSAYLIKKATEKGLPGFKQETPVDEKQEAPQEAPQEGQGCQCGGRVALPQAVGRAGNPIAMRQREPQRMDGGMMMKIMHARKRNGRRKIMGHQ